MDYAALITYLLVMIITPGPNNIMVTAAGANFGYRATLPHLCGIVFGAIFQTILACLGLGAIFTRFPVLHEVLTWVGIIYMLYLSWKMLGLGVENKNHMGKPVTFMQAALFQFVNPKAWIISATVAVVFLPKNEIIIPTLIIIFMEGTFTFAGCTIWTIFGNMLRGFLTKPRNQRMFNITMAVLLLATAAMIVV